VRAVTARPIVVSLRSCGDNERPNRSKSACVPCRTCGLGEGFVSGCVLGGDDTICETCNANSISVGGENPCTPCDDNERPNESKSACIPCISCGLGKGFISECVLGGEDTVCETCDINSISVGGVDSCTPCPDNERPNGSKSACVPCRTCGLGAGFVSGCVLGGEDTICETCDANSVSVGGEGPCTSCGDNERPNGSKSACVPCKFCGVGEGVASTCQMDGSEFKDTVCQVCPAGEFSPGGNSACQQCKPTQYCPAGTPAPRLCSKGSYCSNNLPPCASDCPMPTFSERRFRTFRLRCHTRMEQHNLHA
jgi:hypothetical protein